MESLSVTLLLLVVGLALILVGANYLTDGSVAIARRLNVSGFVIGLTIVAIGTSMPEMVVSVISAFEGGGDMAIGNVVGSNLFNTLVILGVCGIVSPIVLTQRNIYRDIPISMVVSLLLLLATLNGVIGRLEGVALLIIYVASMIYSIRSSRPSVEEQAVEEEVEKQPVMSVWLSVLYTLGGLAGLIYGGSLFIEKAVIIAHHFHIPDSVIAITLLAGGTSLPEFAASMVSLIKGQSDMALGNVIGSSIANILLVLGVSSSITPLVMGGISIIDICFVLASSVLVFVSAFSFDRNKLDRYDGVIMVLIYVGYIVWMINTRLM